MVRITITAVIFDIQSGFNQHVYVKTTTAVTEHNAVLVVHPHDKFKKPIPDVVRHVAHLSGFLARKGDGEPGVETIWIGMRRFGDFVEGMRAAGQIRPSG